MLHYLNIIRASRRRFSPLALGPAVWLSDTGTDPNVWEDLSGNARNLTQSTPSAVPTIVSSALNGRQVRRFSSAQWYEISNSGVSSQSSHSIIAVHKFSASTFYWTKVAGIHLKDVSAAGNLMVQTMNNQFEIGVHNAGVSDTRIRVIPGTLAEMQKWRVSGFTRNGGVNGNGGVVTVRSNDLISTGTQNWSTNQSTNRFEVAGRQQTVTNWFLGDIAEVILIPRAITTDEMQNLWVWLTQKYAIS